MHPLTLKVFRLTIFSNLNESMDLEYAQNLVKLLFFREKHCT